MPHVLPTETPAAGRPHIGANYEVQLARTETPLLACVLLVLLALPRLPPARNNAAARALQRRT